MAESYKVGKVVVTQLSPNVFKLRCDPWRVWTVSPHYDNAMAELGKTHKITGVAFVSAWANYRLVFVE